MGSVGNYLGATMGTSTNEEGKSGAVYDNAFVTNSNYPKRAALIGNDDKFVQKSYDDAQNVEDSKINGYTPDSKLLGEVPGLLSDNSAYQEMQDEVSGPSGETGGTNWETHTFVNMRNEKDALEKSKIDDLSTAWTKHGDDLKTHSENFKKAVKNHLLGHWSGESAGAAESASQQVTKTSIYDFTPSSEAISNRLKVLKGGFDSIVKQFPGDTNSQLIDDGEFDKKGLDKAINSFNNRYEIDGDGYLRLKGDGGYVTAADALNELNEINHSITAYRKAVDLFTNIYNPTAMAAVENFPTLPPPPNMKYGDATDPGGPGTGPGGGPGAGPGTGPGGGPGGTPPIGKPNFGKPAIDKPAIDKPGIDKPAIDKPAIDKPGAYDPTQLPTTGGTNPIKSAMDAATKAGTDAIDKAMNAAKDAAGKGGQPPIGAGGPPEGVLGLGPKGLGAGGGPGAGAGGGGIGKGAGGIGAGLPLKGMPNGIGTAAADTSAVKAPTGASSAGAGLGGGAGSPGAGAPAGGQRGDQNGKGHQVNKALRRKKNGKDVIGTPDAAVPVVGAQDDQEPAESAQTDQSEFRRRIPPRGGQTWQPTSAVQGGSPRSARTQHPGSVDQPADQ